MKLEDVIKEMARKNQERGVNQYSLSQELGKASPVHTNQKLAEMARKNQSLVGGDKKSLYQENGKAVQEKKRQSYCKEANYDITITNYY